MRTLDRYIIREALAPFAIALLVFTFVLIIPFIIDLAETMIAKGVPWPTLLQLMATLVPQALGLTIPMSLLLALLVAFGRLSGDREIVAMMACGVSTYRLLRPVAVLALAAWAATSWVLVKAIPDANQAFREITLQLVADRAEGEVKPRVFFEDFPQTVLYVRDISPTGAGWLDVMAADTRTPAQPTIFLASRGRMLVDRAARTIQMVLEDGTRHTTRPDDATAYEVVRFDRMVVSLDPESVFPRTGPARGYREMSVAELQQEVAYLSGLGQLHHQPVMEIHKKYAIPIACFVFALLGLALGATSRHDGRLASFVLGIAVIFVYYVLMWLAEAMAKGYVVPASLAMWIPNLVLGPVGLILLHWRARSADRPIRVSLPSLTRPAWLERLRPSDATRPSLPAGAVAAPARRRVVVVIRVPQFRLPRPGLLDLYIGRLYLRVLGLSVVGMAGLFYISTFIDMSDKLFKGTVSTGMLLQYFWWATPQFLYYILAIAVLLAALVTIGVLTKNSELIVMRACGISLYRTAVPLLVFSLLASGLLFAMEERLLAVSNQRAHRLRHLIRGGDPQTFDVLNRKWLVSPDGAIYHYQYYDPTRQRLGGLSIFRFDDASGRLVERTYAQQARVTAPGDTSDFQWAAQNGWRRDFSTTGEILAFTPFTEAPVPLEPPAYFVTEVPEPDRMNFGQLQRYIAELRTSGYDVRPWEVDLQRKIAFPFVTFVMTLIAVPFAVTTGRRGALYGVGIGIVLALVYWTLISVFAAFGAGGLLSPVLAAWAPNLLFAACAVVLLLTVRT
ncbi:MAG: LPS export ABC transporter permease LptG [Vicinamibacterales bacterium]|nr:LPS export ABC transporter permease LptG [Vicinamibacterales bacterium]